MTTINKSLSATQSPGEKEVKDDITNRASFHARESRTPEIQDWIPGQARNDTKDLNPSQCGNIYDGVHHSGQVSE